MTYLNDIANVRKEVAKKKKFSVTKKLKMSDDEEQVAQALVRLSENADFKLYKRWEMSLMGQRMEHAFEVPSEGALGTDDFACQMAFNKGRLYQMRYVVNSRNLLQKTYLNKLEKEQDNGKGQEHEG